jgi:quercetin dioxygenase-like cupin family protein
MANMARMTRIVRWIGWTTWLLVALAIGGRWVGTAQATGQATSSSGDDPRFTGISTSLEPTGLTVARRHFEAGARSAWHSHTRGQLLFVEDGRARTQKRGQPLREMGPGESDYTAPNVEHWHGAVPGEAFVQVNVGFGEGISWLDKVTDEEYGGR